MKICNNCNSMQPDSANFCSNCGSSSLRNSVEKISNYNNYDFPEMKKRRNIKINVFIHKVTAIQSEKNFLDSLFCTTIDY